MIESFFSALQAGLLIGGFWGILFLAFLQEVVPPIPSTAVAMSVGFLLFGGMPITAHSLWGLLIQGAVPLALGMTVGSLVVYAVIYQGGKPIIARFGSYIGITWEDVEKFQARLKGSRFEGLLLFVARALPIIPSVAVNAVAGVMRIGVVSFTISTFFGALVRALWSGLIGWQVGSVFEKYANIIENFHTGIFIFLVVVFGIFVWYRRRNKKETISS